MTAPQTVALNYKQSFEQFALYDAEKEQWYGRGNWYPKGHLPRIFRRKGPMKNSLIYLCELHPICTARWRIAERLRREDPTLNYPQLGILARKEQINQLPDSYMMYQITTTGLELIGKAKDWY